MGSAYDPAAREETTLQRTLTAMLTAATLTAAAFGAGACGSDDDSTEAEVGALSKSAFVEQANDLCSKAATDRQSLLSKIDPNAPGPEQAEQLADVVDLDEKLLADVDQLVPPESEQSTVTQLLDQWRKRVDLEEQLRTATADADATQISDLDSKVQQVDTDANQIADDLGLDDCAGGEGV
ncbi:MAG: hypothetical protein ACRDY4_08995 [Acidimicrobiia bacterium]